MKLILVRHGETDWNLNDRIQGILDIPLNSKGLDQARKAGLRLSNEKIDAIYCSPMERAKQTAAEIAKFHDVPIEYNDLISEKNFGEMEGMDRVEYKKIRDNSGIPYHLFTPPQGENYVDVRERLEKFYSSIKEKHAGHTVLVVSHGGVIRTLITLLMKRSIESVKELKQSNAAISVLEINGSSVPRIHYQNSTEHL